MKSTFIAFPDLRGLPKGFKRMLVASEKLLSRNARSLPVAHKSMKPVVIAIRHLNSLRRDGGDALPA